MKEQFNSKVYYSIDKDVIIKTFSPDGFEIYSVSLFELYEAETILVFPYNYIDSSIDFSTVIGVVKDRYGEYEKYIRYQL
jgi:hypothetical protein